MRLSRLALVAFALALGLPGCFCTKTFPPPHAAPTVAEVLAALRARHDAARSFNHTSTMDFWSGDERVKTTVYVMGERGKKLRMNALDPAGGTTLADLACDGSEFGFVDFQHNCQITGPCNEDSIASLMRVRLAPDDFVLLALGQSPLLPGELKGSVAWDEDHGVWKLELHAGDGRVQKLELSGERDKRWDVRAASVWGKDGKLEWKLAQKDFAAVTGADGKVLRLAGKGRFEQPAAKADLIVEWNDRVVNPTLEAGKFHIDIPPGLPRCGQKPAPADPTGTP